MAAPPLGGRCLDVAMVLSLGAQHWSDHFHSRRPQQHSDQLFVFALFDPRLICDMGGLALSCSETDSRRTQSIASHIHNRPTSDPDLAASVFLVFQTAARFRAKTRNQSCIHASPSHYRTPDPLYSRLVDHAGCRFVDQHPSGPSVLQSNRRTTDVSNPLILSTCPHPGVTHPSSCRNLCCDGRLRSRRKWPGDFLVSNEAEE